MHTKLTSINNTDAPAVLNSDSIDLNKQLDIKAAEFQQSGQPFLLP